MPQRSPLGVIMLPTVFGLSLSVRWHARQLRRAGYPVRVLDLYRGQVIRRPCCTAVLGRSHQSLRLTALAHRLDHEIIFRALDQAALAMVSHSERVAFMGFGLGGYYALKYVEHNHWIAGVLAWYPPLLFSPPPPVQSLDCKRTVCPVTLFYGDSATLLERGTIEYAQALPGRCSNFTVITFNEAAYGFADLAVQYCLPSPWWRPVPSRRSWQRALRTLERWAHMDSFDEV